MGKAEDEVKWKTVPCPVCGDEIDVPEDGTYLTVFCNKDSRFNCFRGLHADDESFERYMKNRAVKLEKMNEQN